MDLFPDEDFIENFTLCIFVYLPSILKVVKAQVKKVMAHFNSQK